MSLAPVPPAGAAGAMSVSVAECAELTPASRATAIAEASCKTELEALVAAYTDCLEAVRSPLERELAVVVAFTADADAGVLAAADATLP